MRSVQFACIMTQNRASWTPTSTNNSTPRTQDLRVKILEEFNIAFHDDDFLWAANLTVTLTTSINFCTQLGAMFWMNEWQTTQPRMGRRYILGQKLFFWHDGEPCPQTAVQLVEGSLKRVEREVMHLIKWNPDERGDYFASSFKRRDSTPVLPKVVETILCIKFWRSWWHFLEVLMLAISY